MLNRYYCVVLTDPYIIWLGIVYMCVCMCTLYRTVRIIYNNIMLGQIPKYERFPIDGYKLVKYRQYPKSAGRFWSNVICIMYNTVGIPIAG